MNIDNYIGPTHLRDYLFGFQMKSNETPFRAKKNLVEILACEDFEQRVLFTRVASGIE